MKILSSFLLISAVMSAKAQTHYDIKGKVALKVPYVKAIIICDNGLKPSIEDTVSLFNGSFSFKGDIDRPSLASIILLSKDDLKPKKSEEEEDEGGNKLALMIYANGNTFIDWTTEKPIIKCDNPEQKIWDKYMKDMTEFNKTNKSEDFGAMMEVVKAFIAKEPDSYVSLDLVQTYFASIIVPKTFEPVFYSLSERLQKDPQAQSWLEKLDVAKKLDAGQPSIDFTQNDVNGKPVTLSSYKGQYVLVDFWASWCGPCRASNPELLVTYAKYKDKKFSILGVSLDSQKSAWLKAIKDDGLPWTQVSDLTGSDNAAAKLYSVEAIPQNILIGPDGTIVGKNLKGADLDNRLNELLK